MRFETEQDRINELKVAELFAEKSNLSPWKMNNNSLDFILHDDKGNAKCFLEIKCYNNPSHVFESVIVSLIKWEKMLEYEVLAPTYFICKHSDDVILYIRAKDIKGNVKKISRNNPRESAANDTEFCIFVNKKDMKKW